MNRILNISGSNEKFRVNNIFCIGKNYFDHIKEFGDEKAPISPVIFFKPSTSIVQNNGIINIPEFNGKKISNNVHYETEVVVAIDNDCRNVKESDATENIFGYGIGIDLTLRDVQSDAKKLGLPWGTSKGFFNSAPVSDLLTKLNITDPMNLDFSLEINNTIKQFSNTSLMIINIYKLISYLSTIFGLSKGDLIFTGTPEGVGQLKQGDELRASLSGMLELKVRFNG
ncbi:MAG: fumarylacetoacetate hydrolase family protein [Ignavibacteria bacterium]